MATRRPEDLSDAEACARVFPTLQPAPWPSPVPPASWPHRVKPKGEAALPDLDAIVEEILKKKQPEAVKCPYYMARWWIVTAARVGKDAIGKEDAIRKEHAGKKAREDLAKRILQASGLLLDILEQKSPSIDDERNVTPNNARGFSRPDYDAENLARGRLFQLLADIRPAAPALIELAGMMQAAEEERLTTMSRRSATPWLNGFVETLGYWWTEIWGEMPAKPGDSPFADFARAAYAVMGGDENELTTQTIRTIVARVRGGGDHKGRRDDDQFDRYERIMAEQRARRKAVGEERWQEETAAAQAELRALWPARPSAYQAALKDLLDATKAGSEVAAETLKRAYANASATDKAFLENLGYPNPKPH